MCYILLSQCHRKRIIDFKEEGECRMKKVLPYIISILAAIIVNMLLIKFDFSAYVLLVIDIVVCMLVGFMLKDMNKE